MDDTKVQPVNGCGASAITLYGEKYSITNKSVDFKTPCGFNYS